MGFCSAVSCSRHAGLSTQRHERSYTDDFMKVETDHNAYVFIGTSADISFSVSIYFHGREEELERRSVLVLDGKFNTRFISITSLRGRENS